MLEFYITEEDLDNINGTVLNSLYSNFEKEFEREKYLLERYTRKRDLEKDRATFEDVDVKPISAYEKFITDMATGYFAGKPNTYFNKENKNLRIVTTKGFNGYDKYTLEKIDNKKEKDDDEFLNYILGIYEYNNEPRENKKLTYRAFITSRAYEMVYTNEDGKIKFSIIEDKCFPFKKNNLSKDIIGFTRMVEYNTLDENDNITIKRKIELYTKNKRVYFDEDEMYSEEHDLPNSESFVKGEWEIPISELKMDYDIGLFEQEVPNIRSYELVNKNTKSIENYNDSAILKISGVDFNAYQEEGKENPTPDEVVTKIKSSGAIFVDGDGSTDASWLIKSVNDSSTQNHKNNLKNDIFNTSGLFNPEQDNQVYQNTLSLQFKLYKLETKISAFQQEFENLIKHRNKIICEIVNLFSNKEYEYNQIGILFNRNIPTNVGEEINLANQLKDILPMKELYRRLSFIDNADKMFELWKEEQIELAKLEAEKEKVYNEITMEDMYTESMQQFDEDTETIDDEIINDESQDRIDENEDDEQL